MHALKAKIPVFCSYAVAFAAMALMGYTAACAPRPQDQWNSYYYGTTADYGSGYGSVDADDNYRLPADMTMPGDDRSLQEDTVIHGGRWR